MTTHRAAEAHRRWAEANALVVAVVLHPVAWGTLLANALRVMYGMQRAYRYGDDAWGWGRAGFQAILLELMGLGVSHEWLEALSPVLRARPTARQRVWFGILCVVLVVYAGVTVGFNVVQDGWLGLLLPGLSLVALALINMRAVEQLEQEIRQASRAEKLAGGGPKLSKVLASGVQDLAGPGPDLDRGGRILAYFSANPSASLRQASKELGLPRSTVQYWRRRMMQGR